VVTSTAIAQLVGPWKRDVRTRRCFGNRSGQDFYHRHVIQQVQRPAIIMGAEQRLWPAQLYGGISRVFPEQLGPEYFRFLTYDYYQA